MLTSDLKPVNARDLYLDLFAKNRDLLFSDSPEYIRKIREEAINSFALSGIPAPKTENYKYTSINIPFEKNLTHVLTGDNSTVNMDDVFRCDVPDLNSEVILVLNGFYRNGELTTMDNGIIYGSLKTASSRYPELFKEHYTKYAKHGSDGIVALNTAFASDGVFLYVPKNKILDKPLQIIHLLWSDEPRMVQHRNLFILGDNASAKVLICDHTLSSSEFLTNSVTEIYTGPGANIDLLRLQNEHNKSSQVTNTYIHQERSSKVNTNYMTLHGGLVRNNLHIDLAGPGSEVNARGLFLTDKKQHIDNYVYINHFEPDCTSNQLYKGILDEESTAAFSGKIHVWQKAQHTMAYQKNNNILLTDTAKMHTKPQLEIYADDVKCSHGATVGQLNTDALFYLRSRGISAKESLHLLMYAFTDEVIKEINLPSLKERITNLVDKRLRGELSQCNNCRKC